MTERFCLECAKPLIRPPHTSNARWAKRRHCSQACVARDRSNKRYRQAFARMRSPVTPYGRYGDIGDEVFNDER